MSNDAVCDAAAVFKSLEDHKLTVRSMFIEKDSQKQPLTACFTFKESVESIPATLPSKMVSEGQEIPVLYSSLKNG